MKNDSEIQKNVMAELQWLPLLNANEIGVSVKNGIVTLSGIVDSYPKKIKIERAVRHVSNVRGIAENIIVRLSEKDRKDDTEIAQAVLHELNWHCNLDPDKIKVFVEDGYVTLEGSVNWDFQRRSAAKTILNIKGVQGVHNNIGITPAAPTDNLKEMIVAAFKRKSSIDSSRITITVNGSKVVLSGSVRTCHEMNEAEKIVWSAPGISSVVNELQCSEV